MSVVLVKKLKGQYQFTADGTDPDLILTTFALVISSVNVQEDVFDSVSRREPAFVNQRSSTINGKDSHSGDVAQNITESLSKLYRSKYVRIFLVFLSLPMIELNHRRKSWSATNMKEIGGLAIACAGDFDLVKSAGN